VNRSFKEDLENNLRDPEFAKRFGAARAKSNFAITLSETRRSLNLTQKELANKLGVSQSYIAKLEGGEANPTLDRIGSLLAILGLSLTTGTTALSPKTNNLSLITIWSRDDMTIHSGDDILRESEINYERMVRSKVEKRELEELPV
jgi:transcriptional regulator with XRE-family HTH domain